MDKDFWKGKKVLITGHTGFKGSWLSVWLHSMGADVLGYSLEPPTDPSLFKVAGIGEVIPSVHGDIRDLSHLQKVYEQHRPEIIIHMAAQALVRASYDDPVGTYETNVMGTVKVLEAARQVESVRVIVSVTSDKCYENREWHWGYREDEAMGGFDPYSSSKGCAELATAAYRRSYFGPGQAQQGAGVGLATVRAGNVIGGGDWGTDRLIPDIMRAFLDRSKVVIRNPQAIRPWQHVLDPLHGYLLLAEKLWTRRDEFVGGWNFGANDDDVRPVAWIVEQLASRCPGGLDWARSTESQPHEATFLKLDCSRAKQLLGWAPGLDLATALQWVVDWFAAFQEGRDMLQYTKDEIVRYESIL